MVLSGLKNGYKFNKTVFITRFNLVLVWFKILQILTKVSHPNGSGIIRSPGLVLIKKQKILIKDNPATVNSTV